MSIAELYDELQRMFGIGDWSPASEDAWWEARMNQIIRLKAMLRSRRLTTDDVYLAAQYAHANHIPVVAAWRLFELIPEAKKANRVAPADRLQAAITEALAAGDDAWAMRLDQVHRNDDRAVAAVLKEYENR